jgi:hypothetical protein
MSPNSDERIVYFCFLLILKIIKTNLKDDRRDLLVVQVQEIYPIETREVKMKG